MKSNLFKLTLIASSIIYSNNILANNFFTNGNKENITTTINDQKESSVTIYNDNLALVKDVRNIKKIPRNLIWKDVSSQLITDSTQLRDTANPNSFHLLSQNFDFDLLTPNKLLDKYVGKTITVIHTNPSTGVEAKENATILSTNSGIVLQYSDRIETGLSGRVSLKEIPSNLKDKPTLSLELAPKNNNGGDLELSYLTRGLGWKAAYVANLDNLDKTIQLNGWITLSNTSGTSFNEAKVQLVAGDINQVQPKNRNIQYMKAEVMAMNADMAGSSPKEESFSDYHLYTLPRKISINENQSKQVSLLTAPQVIVSKKYILNGGSYYYQNQYAGEISKKIKFDTYLEFDNKTESGLGIPLPKGIFRVYKKDSQGNAQFIGEDNIEHTAKNDKISLKLGKAFDITADKKQTSFERIQNQLKGRYNQMFDEEFEIYINNGKKESVSVTIVEPIPGQWEILSESFKHTKESSNTASWNISIPPESNKTLKYKVRVKY